jgi:hypothetical protein
VPFPLKSNQMDNIRKISIGPDYKGSAMHYILGQRVLGDTNEIHLIRFDEQTNSFKIFISNDKKEVLLWKEFNSTIPVAIEYNINI